ncbi:Transcriptional regulator YqjI [Serratia fonticola]|uniref:Transcriptional regulator YqjI n=1 Tax=Serratia fonticola TaxID=47917 RepID=A0A4U9TWN4_SERFO|nr:Transcriptional regulator YqjI [Serratia fonticola]
MAGAGAGVIACFEHGDLRLVLLALVERKPSHGYELIKAIEEASSGLYAAKPRRDLPNPHAVGGARLPGNRR